MKISIQSLMLFGIWLIATSLFAQVATEADSVQLLELTNSVVDLQLADDSWVANATVAEVKVGKLPDSIKSLKVETPNSKRLVNVSANKINEIFRENRPLDVEYDRKNRCLVHSPEKKDARLKHRQEVELRLAQNRDRYWQPLSPEEQEQRLAKQHEFLKEVESKMPHISFRLVETEYFLFFTDLSSPEVDGYIVYLDAMYNELCKAFGLPPEKNVWAGKCAVVAFHSERDYQTFETSIMNQPNAAGTQGLCHQSSDGNVIFAGYKGDNNFFGHVLVHETSHGFVHRYLSTARTPSWLDEGMSDWLADVIVKGDSITRRQKDSALLVRQHGGWGDFLTTDQISFDHYGSASTLVTILLAIDKGDQFREFFIAIKEGKPADESLKDSFGISYQDLEILYARRTQRVK